VEKRGKSPPERAVTREIPEELSKVISPLPKEKQKKIVTALQKIEMSRFSSPLPPPEMLHGYAQIIPDSPERLLAMAEEGQRADNAAREHMINGQIKLHKYNFIRDIAWVIFFLALILAVLGGGIFLIICGYREEGKALLGAGGIGALILVALAAYFQRDERADKNKRKA